MSLYQGLAFSTYLEIAKGAELSSMDRRLFAAAVASLTVAAALVCMRSTDLREMLQTSMTVVARTVPIGTAAIVTDAGSSILVRRPSTYAQSH